MSLETMLSREMIERLTAYVAGGVSVRDACMTEGITSQVFYAWRTRGNNLLRQLDEQAEREGIPVEELLPGLSASDRLRVQFAESVTKAAAQARVVAVNTLRTAITQGGEEISRTTENYTETRLRSVRRTVMETQPDGSTRPVTVAEEVPYEYKVRRERVTTRHMPPDGRLALEFLARSDPENWAQRKFVDVTWREKAKEDLLKGILTWEILSEAYGEEAAAGLFEELGFPVPLLDAGVGNTVEGHASAASSGSRFAGVDD